MIKRNTSFLLNYSAPARQRLSSTHNKKTENRQNENTSKVKGSNLPFLLRPVGKDYLWGGQRLNNDYNKNISLNPLAETWECSTHPDGPSIVASGVYANLDLRTVLKLRPDFLGKHPAKLVQDGLPVMIKLIDAKNDLSVQVHPSDEYAKKNENGQLGKFEMWYVIDAASDSKLAYGFKTDTTKSKLRRGISDGSIENCLQYITVHKGDVFLIPPGTVHAIGAGILLAEIQESSNLTYRLYDYNRIGKDGKKRELHIQKALDVINLKSSAAPRQPIRKLEYKPGYASELLGRCKYFEVERIQIHTECVRTMTEISAGNESFIILLCINGCADLFGERTLINIFKGDCIFIPANSVKLRLHGKAEFLKVRC